MFYLIKQLDEIDRTIITMHLDGYENLKIAEMLGITANHTNVKIHRLKNQIISKFKKISHGHL